MLDALSLIHTVMYSVVYRTHVRFRIRALLNIHMVMWSLKGEAGWLKEVVEQASNLDALEIAVLCANALQPNRELLAAVYLDYCCRPGCGRQVRHVRNGGPVQVLAVLRLLAVDFQCPAGRDVERPQRVAVVVLKRRDPCARRQHNIVLFEKVSPRCFQLCSVFVCVEPIAMIDLMPPKCNDLIWSVLAREASAIRNVRPRNLTRELLEF